MATNNSDELKGNSMDEYLVPLEIPCVYYIPSLLTGAESQSYYKTLHQTVPWEKTPKINRWVFLLEIFIK